MRAKTPNIPVEFVGLFCLTFDDDGNLHNQGQVVACLTPEIYLIQIFEWVMGSPSGMVLRTLTDMRTWHFYRTEEAWHEAADAENHRLLETKKNPQ